MAADLSASMKEFIAQLVPQFLDDTQDKLRTLEGLLLRLRGRDTENDDFLELARIIHSLKGSAAVVGFPFIGVLCHKLEGYLGKVSQFTEQVVTDVDHYLDAIEAIVEQAADPEADAAQEIYRQLPDAVVERRAEDDFVLDSKPLVSLFIGPKNVQLRIIEDQLKNCGIQVVSYTKSLQGIEMAISTNPDLVMVAYMIDMLSGPEVCSIMRAIHRTRQTPLMLITSEVATDEHIRSNIPDDVVVVRKGPYFPNDFADALCQLRIL